jgi:acetyltransferase
VNAISAAAAPTTKPAARSPRDLEPLFAPRTIAVLGASRKPDSPGNAIVRNLILGGYTGVVVPINPNASSIYSLRCYPSVAVADVEIDLAVIVLPAPAVEAALIECSEAGVRHFVVISAGFKEVGGEGQAREERLRSLARERCLSILGPNCLGVINTAEHVRMNATFAGEMPPRGNLGLISQSGALCSALLEYARGRHIGFSRFVSFGNKADLTEIDLLRSLATDPLTQVILMYVEDITNGPDFVETAYQITHGADPKPILAIKTGRTREGATAAASHTGALAGSDEVYEAIMQQAGVIRVDSVEDLFDHAEAFKDPRLPTGRHTGIVTNAGGPGIMATDACIRYGLKLAHFQDYTRKSLQFQMPPNASLKNPVDVIGDARHDRYRAALDAVAADEGVDQVVVLITPQMMTNLREIADVIAEVRSFCPKPIVACPMGLAGNSEAVQRLTACGVPTFPFPENAMRALAAKARFAEWVHTPRGEFRLFEVDSAGAAALLAAEREAGRSQLVELRALEVLRCYGLPVAEFTLARSADEAVEAAERLGYPVALKVSGPTILHKTDVGGVRLRLADAAAVRSGCEELINGVRRKLGEQVELWGVLVQRMLPPGKEIILGMTRDARLGPLLMFGLGGIYTEVLRDVAFRLAPIRDREASEMIHGIRAIRLLEGVRGESPSDLAALADCLLRLSQLATEQSAIRELDINPLLVYPRGQGTAVVDARIILGEN